MFYNIFLNTDQRNLDWQNKRSQFSMSECGGGRASLAFFCGNSFISYLISVQYTLTINQYAVAVSEHEVFNELSLLDVCFVGSHFHIWYEFDIASKMPITSDDGF